MEYVDIENAGYLTVLFGIGDEHVKIIEDELDVRIALRDDKLTVEGDEENTRVAVSVINRLLKLIKRNERIDRSRIRYAVELAKEGKDELIEEIMSDVVAITHKGAKIRCKTLGQQKYVRAIEKNTVVFGVGPAGTGKTYLAMANAVMAFKNKEISKIILTRPAVEAGEKLGFLPGDLQQKVDPYLRPLYDAIYEMMGVEAYQKLWERGVIEVAPLAYMRGRTLNDAFIILDEAQNTTIEQMKMFLTRLGEGSRMVITGDLTQIDLPMGKTSGLKHAISILNGIDKVAVCHLTAKDVVRHEIVMNIIKAYEKGVEQKR
ncbi:MAG: PhoH family protein [Clostridia bacterium]|jgi:phosphate starvation-inducible PhoH-like protein|nr:PhoH family protein [Clostridia bacterium]